MIVVEGSLTADAVIQVAQSGSISAEAVIRATGHMVKTLLFSDDFNRTTAFGLGGDWSWSSLDSKSGDPNTPTVFVDGAAVNIVAATGQTTYESYEASTIGVPLAGEIWFDFWVPSAGTATNRPIYGFLLDGYDYTGVYVDSYQNPAGSWCIDQSAGSIALFTPDVDTWYRLRSAWDGSTFWAKVWKVGDAEPATWNLETAQAFTPSREIAHPVLDFFYAPIGPVPGKVDNVEIWRTGPTAVAAAAVIRQSVTQTLSASAVQRRVQEVGLTADAVLVSWFTADAILKATMPGSLTASAWIYAPRSDPGGPGGHGETPLVSIMVDDVDITADVIVADATFSMQVNGMPGQFRFRVKDVNHTHGFTSGVEVTLDIDGKRRFGGYLMIASRAFFFPVENTTVPTDVERGWTLEGVDYNILFSKRVIRDKTNPANVGLREWAAGSRDDTVIKYVFNHYTDLAADGVTCDGVTHVGSPNPDKKGVVGSGGLTFGDAMTEINRLINGVFYIDPYKILHFVDVDTPTTTLGLSDNPGAGELGYRELIQISDGTKLANDALVWGSGIGAKDMVFSRSQSTASITAHKRWQYGEFTTQIYKQASADTRADSVVNGTPQNRRGGKNDAESWNITTFNSSFYVGQKVAIESEVFGVGDVLPIRRMTITFPAKRPQFQLVLSHEIDLPWNIFEMKFPRITTVKPKTIEVILVDPPPPPGGCADAICGITDSFARVVADVPHSTVGAVDGGWGTSDSGRLWQMYIFKGPACSAYVDGSVGVLHTVGAGDFSNGASVGHEMHNVSFPTGDWDLTYDFWWGNLMNLDGSNQGISGLTFFTSPDCSTGWIGELCFMNRPPSTLGSSQGTIWFWDYANEFTWDTLWVAQTWYSAKVHYDSVSQTLKARVWIRGNAEPTIWHATLVLATPLMNSIEIGYSNRWGRIGDDQTDFKLDNISLPGVNRCSEYRFDNFNRTVSGGWGTSDYGTPWTDFASGTLPSGLDGSRVYASGDATYAAYTTAAQRGTGPWSGDFVMTARFQFSGAPSGTWGYLMHEFLVQSPLESGRADVRAIWTPSRQYVEYFIRDDAGSILLNTTVDVPWVSDVWYILKWDTQNGLRVWQGSDPEPSTWLTGSNVAVPVFARDLWVGVTTDKNTSSYLDCIDFDYAGKPCYCVGMFDTFARTVSDGWGTSDAGLPWQTYIFSGTASVDGSGATLSINDVALGNPGVWAKIESAAGPWAGRPFTMRVRMKWPTLSVYVTDMWDLHDGANQGIVQVAAAASGWIYLESVSAVVGFVADQWYLFEIVWPATADGTATATIWLDGTTKPSPQVSKTGGWATSPFTPYIALQRHNSISHNPSSVVIDSIDFIYDGKCVSGGLSDPSHNPANGRWGLVGDGTSRTFSVSVAYHPGTTQVYVNGHFYRPGIEYTESNPAAGEITFVNPPAEGVHIDAFYEANGTPF